ncbi:Fur family transcriptional regulator [Euzebya tangerina]|uniref:Fur family transcriptional regulator n=1 Tax=Euzebya tangerina TaxID=591198 RepID=UPI0013C3712C|nr:Fur family transcriptional regulator [Euzebya tangerina]
MPVQLLRDVGLRVTRQRTAVLDALADRPEAVSAQELYTEFRNAGDSIGLSTVYRALESLDEAGLLDSFPREGEQVYRRCSPKHHHHLICIDCSRVEELEATLVEDWVASVSNVHDFEVTGHRADIYGRCIACAA